ncbi:MerR family transcriptional regulator [Mannheimia granulomatis]|uniref:MerR family transcriptional regulator n=1 Tax=Mannheimia granulomatis TaxID=85402 RepID=UPI00159DFFE0|nr:MerR family transcriptional regulator [Mannheimia granulomatis]QLB14085.1 MerR family transcriptional regulator [Mannheimia granulomatis]
MKVNELSQKSGIKIETIRYYEKIGVLPTPKRQINGYRLYDENTLCLLNFIKTCRMLGFSIEEIKQLNQIRNRQIEHYVADKLVIDQLKKVEKKIEQLNKIKSFLQELVIEEAHNEEECRAINGLKI